MRFIRRIRKFLSLSGDEQKLLSQTVLLVAGVRASLTLSSLDAALRWSERFVGNGSRSSHATEADTEQAVLAVRRASTIVPGASCLTQAIATKALLARRGQASTLRLGVAKKDEDLEAHAWLEADGKVLIGEFEERRFTPLV